MAGTGARQDSTSATTRGALANARLITPACFVLAALALLAFAGCGESKQEQARKTVCSARSDIETRISTLATLTPSIAAVGQVKDEAGAIADDLKKIAGAQQNLDPSRKAQVQQATETFGKELESTIGSATSSLSLSNASTKLKSALEQLKRDYAQALAPINCS